MTNSTLVYKLRNKMVKGDKHSCERLRVASIVYTRDKVSIC